MRPTENIEKLIKNISIETSAKTDKAVLEDVVEAFEKSKSIKTTATKQNIWRIIMKSRITKLAAAAAIVFLFSLFSINILVKRLYTEKGTIAQHVITEIDTSPRYILFNAQNNSLYRKEVMPCNILPVLPSQF